MGRDARIAMVRLGADRRQYEKDLRDAEKATQTWGNRVKGHITRSLRGAFGGLGGITGLAGIAGFGAIARDVMKFDEALVNLQISAGKSRGEMLKFNDQLQKVAASTGAQQDELIAGAQKYTELTGKFDEFAASLDVFAKAQVATGASMESLVGAAAALSSNLNVDPSQMLGALDAIAAQGKSGKIEIKDLAATLPGLTGQFAQFNTTGTKGTIELGAAMQIMARGFGSASETATGMSSLMTAFVKNSKELKSIGVDVFDKNGKARDFADIMFQLIDKSKGDPRVLQRVLGRTEAVQAILPVMAAGREEFERFIALGGKGGTIMADFAEKEKSVGVQMAKAKAQLTAAFNKALINNLDVIVAAFQAIVKALSWMASHPEALAGLAVLWKGGGFLSTIGGLGIGAGAGGAGGGLAGVAGAAAGGARGARLVQATGGMMQGAAVGYALSRTGEKLNDGFDSLATAGVTAAGALAGLGGPIGLLGAAIMGIKVVTDFYIAGIEEQQRQMAKRTLDEFFLERGRGLGIGANGIDLRGGSSKIAPGAAGERQRSDARSVLQEGITQGFIKADQSGNFQMDRAAMQKFVQSQPGWDEERKKRAGAIFDSAFRVMTQDPELRDFTRQGLYGTSQVMGQDGLTPGWQGGTWQEQMALGAFDQRAQPAPFVFGQGSWEDQQAANEAAAPGFTRQPGGAEIRIRIVPTEGISAVVENDTKNRRRGGR